MTTPASRTPKRSSDHAVATANRVVRKTLSCHPHSQFSHGASENKSVAAASASPGTAAGTRRPTLRPTSDTDSATVASAVRKLAAMAHRTFQAVSRARPSRTAFGTTIRCSMWRSQRSANVIGALKLFTSRRAKTHSSWYGTSRASRTIATPAATGSCSRRPAGDGSRYALARGRSAPRGAPITSRIRSITSIRSKSFGVKTAFTPRRWSVGASASGMMPPITTGMPPS